MILDELMPVYDLLTRHERILPAKPAIVYPLARQMTIRTLPAVRLLLWLREWPSRLSGQPLEQFPIIAEDPGREIVRAICGRFWAFSGNILDIPTQQIPAFEREGFGKAYWSFYCQDSDDGRTRLITELRVRLYGPQAQKNFSRYWVLVGPFSGWIRMQCLKAIAKRL